MRLTYQSIAGGGCEVDLPKYCTGGCEVDLPKYCRGRL